MIEIRAVKLRFRPQKQKLEEIERRKKRQSQRGIAFLFDKNHFAEFARIRAEAFGALQVGEDFHEYPIRYNARMAAHFYKDVEKVVFLIAFFIVALDFGEFGSILAFLVYFRNHVHAETESRCVRVVFEHCFAEPKHIEVENVRVPRKTIQQPTVALEKICVPYREITYVR